VHDIGQGSNKAESTPCPGGIVPAAIRRLPSAARGHPAATGIVAWSLTVSTLAAVTITLAIIAIVVSIGSGIVAWKARGDSRSSAQIAAAALHETYRPAQPRDPDFPEELNQRTGRRIMFFLFTPPRTYRVAGDATHGTEGRSSRTPLVLSQVVMAGKPVKVFVGEMTGGKGPALPISLNIRFWPPAPGDQGEQWICRCGLNNDQAGPPHWEWNVPVPLDRDYDIRASLG
jgi:hypothetical protein